MKNKFKFCSFRQRLTFFKLVFLGVYEKILALPAKKLSPCAQVMVTCLSFALAFSALFQYNRSACFIFTLIESSEF